MAHLELSDVLVGLRKELEQAQANAEKENLKFNVDSIDVEVQVTIEKKAEAEAGVKWKFWVVGEAEVGGKTGISKEAVQTIRLKLTPSGPTGSVLVGGEIKNPTKKIPKKKRGG